MTLITIFAVFTYFFGFSRFFGYKLICRGMEAMRTGVQLNMG